MSVIEALNKALELLRSGYIDAAYDLIKEALEQLEGRK